MNALSHILKQYHKDQISLSNLKIKLQSLTEKIKKMRFMRKEERKGKDGEREERKSGEEKRIGR